MANAIDIQVMEQHFKQVRLFSTAGLVNALQQERAEGNRARSPIASPFPISSS
jgi:hypothetical protein